MQQAGSLFYDKKQVLTNISGPNRVQHSEKNKTQTKKHTHIPKPSLSLTVPEIRLYYLNSALITEFGL